MFKSFSRNLVPNERLKLHCNECERSTIHQLEAQCTGKWEDPFEAVEGGGIFSIYRCGGCDSICFRSASWNSEWYEHDEDGQMYLPQDLHQYPSPVSKDFSFDRSYTPPGLDSLLDEMLFCFGGQKYVLATVGLRMVLEFICKDANCTGRTLEKQVDDLQAKSLIDADQHNLLQKIRKRGNAGAHQAYGMNTRELISGMEIIDLLIEKLYNQPGKSADRVTRAKKVLT